MIPTITTIDKQGRSVCDLLSLEFFESRKIILVGEITNGLSMEIISQIEYLDRQNNKDIFLYINSPGGSVSAGLAIMDAMNRSKSDIATVCTGMAASMGAFLTACGAKGKRYITPYAEMMIHQPLGGARGQASDIERAAANILKTKKILNQIIAEATGKDVQEVTVDTDRDYYLSAEEAVAYGLVDRVLDDKTQL
ncbi:MAG: ATP-dependent Clp protease proteolytic subunit [Oscillospiraceae bacterium]|nr:ATP-dependent Clp protease proteolytic subunit [Oscillospiraceae bacterium]